MILKKTLLVLLVLCLLLREEINLILLYVGHETTWFGLSLHNARTVSHVLAVLALLCLAGHLKSRS
ncbi:hypothetical protein [Paenibacillus mucilaginosus]|uniref:Uncharacterized protein n=1 Tax=Paenibacillus mucilaginosus (strain KNP414) TaxID=1036673 RepID=F8FL32_PAEMK|nr:hypothetical protein [Paenibacillus mucilaginosus]AEI39951.1 hypothetical protein KNP414_01387 [Paenibacillus mucilaginosus KNP414]MCG7216377.1 hypothetical protein [Paenibacillus mucilaginosus]WDM29211.1 hypothetical protein KCX80_08675 [Paenibacillus mucilaginosus]